MKEKLYLGSGYYDAPAVWVREGQKTGVYFIHRDYLGSILQLVDPQGNLVEENSFDAWGCRRDAVTQQPYAEGKAPKLLLGRGFTGHEHLAVFGLVNMNARLYDPVLGRFLSPDPYVQFPDYTQAFNRYSYCLNSPLCYVDENGEFIEWIIGAAIIGGFINVAAHWNSIDNFWQGFGYFGVGAAAGAVGAVTGGAVGGAGFIGGAIGGFVGGASSGFVTGFGNGLVSGSGFANALYAGAGGALYGSVSGAFGGAVIGGATAFFKGQNVWSGQEIAAGRNAFSLKNTPIEVSSPHRVMSPIPDKIPQVALVDKPLDPVDLAPSINSNSSVDVAKLKLSQTSENITRFITTPEGVTHDLQPTINRINNGVKYTFRHDGGVYWNKEQRLPLGKYTEYIHPTPGLVKGAGPMRIIVGDNGTWWFTPDHHITFIRIKF